MYLKFSNGDMYFTGPVKALKRWWWLEIQYSYGSETLFWDHL